MREDGVAVERRCGCSFFWPSDVSKFPGEGTWGGATGDPPTCVVADGVLAGKDDGESICEGVDGSLVETMIERRCGCGFFRPLDDEAIPEFVLESSSEGKTGGVVIGKIEVVRTFTIGRRCGCG